jgi:RecB family exonuclease
MRHAAQLVRHEWELGPREFGGAELIFGDPEPVALELTGGTLYVEGAIDRVDLRQRGELDLRDLKTGRACDLAETPMEIGIDLQLGVYTLALDAAGIFPDARTVGATAESLAALRGYTEGWIAIARSVLAACAFVRTPDPDNCRYCSFKASCGDRAQARSREKLRSAVPLPLSAFMALKCPEGAGE